jgi:ABC-type polar amino acid transport system ATPase subunit
MLEVDRVDFAYDGGPGILEEVSLSVEPGTIAAILGESGSGKTTLLKCVGRFLRPRSGEVRLDGRNVRDLPEKDLRARLGIVFQELDLFPHLTVLRNLTLAPEKVLGERRDAVERRAREMLVRMRMAETADRHPSEISGGQAQRVAIARALLMEPEYLLLDEPTAALDVDTTDDFGRWLLELRELTTFVVVTHDVAFASQVASTGTLLKEGRVIREGTLEEILEGFGAEREPSSPTGGNGG